MRKRWVLAVCLLLAGGLWSGPAALSAAEGAPVGSAATGGGEMNPGVWLAGIFRDHISAVDGDRCPSYPSCSRYSVQAFEKHGFAMGWLMTVDRLIHEGAEEQAVSGTVVKGGKAKIDDPVQNNDFWWYSPDDGKSD